MSIKILTKNGVDVTNIDGARQFNFSAGMRSGIVKGAFNEGTLFASSNNTIALDTCELIISGHRVIIESVQSITLANAPSVNTKKSLFAEIVVNEASLPTFRLFVEASIYNLRQDNLFKNNMGNGTYQIEIGTFLHKTDGTIVDVFRTIDVITGGYGTGGNGSIEDIKFNASAVELTSDSQPTANIDYNEETKKYDFVVGIPRANPIANSLTIGSVSSGYVASASITGNAPNQELNLVLPKGDVGLSGLRGSIIKVGTQITSGKIGVVSGTLDFSALAGDIYINESTYDVYQFYDSYQYKDGDFIQTVRNVWVNMFNIKGKVGATFSYDETTKTLNIITE